MRNILASRFSHAYLRRYDPQNHPLDSLMTHVLNQARSPMSRDILCAFICAET
jgi:hypothetical protein